MKNANEAQIVKWYSERGERYMKVREFKDAARKVGVQNQMGANKVKIFKDAADNVKHHGHSMDRSFFEIRASPGFAEFDKGRLEKKKEQSTMMKRLARARTHCECRG